MYSDRQPPENESDETKQENCEVHDDTHVDDVIMEEEDVNLGQLLVESDKESEKDVEELSETKESRFRLFFRHFRLRSSASPQLEISDGENQLVNDVESTSPYKAELGDADSDRASNDPEDVPELIDEGASSSAAQPRSLFRNLFTPRSMSTASTQNTQDGKFRRFTSFFRKPKEGLEQISESELESGDGDGEEIAEQPTVLMSTLRQPRRPLSSWFRDTGRKTMLRSSTALRHLRPTKTASSTARYMTDSMNEWMKIPLAVIRCMYAIEKCKLSSSHTLTYWLRMLGAVLINESDVDTQTKVREVCETTGLVDFVLQILQQPEGQSCRATAVLCNTVLLYMATSSAVLDAFADMKVPSIMISNLKVWMEAAQTDHSCIFERPADIEALGVSVFRVVVLSAERETTRKQWYDLGILPLVAEFMLSFPTGILLNELGSCIFGSYVDFPCVTDDEIRQMTSLVPIRLGNSGSSVKCYQQMFYVLYRGCEVNPGCADDLFTDSALVAMAKRCMCRVLATRTRDQKELAE
ncbi:MAG: uncharacterized protein KVP18_001583, partial [Porospora cf. gigantea A]|uniref:uncharacterized protein n=1 Tax=Porospora cf. gigantea A TaxID=2853593 RepID=UPI003559DFD6